MCLIGRLNSCFRQNESSHQVRAKCSTSQAIVRVSGKFLFDILVVRSYNLVTFLERLNQQEVLHQGTHGRSH